MAAGEPVSTSGQAARISVVALVGPTCTGKTALACRLAEALGGEIVACDSRTIYRHMDIGTAKPSPAEQAGIRHHMLDLADPDETYTVAQYSEQAARAIAGAAGRGRLPIVVGGTGFYARALLQGLDIPPVPPDDELRAALNRLAESDGNPALHARLAAIDPLAASRIAPNDRFRVIRALEVSTVTGRPFSQWQRRVEPPYRTVWLGLTYGNRISLNQAIAARFRQQMADGLLAEVSALLERYGPCRAIMNTVNYKELVPYLAGQEDLSYAESQCLRHTCQLARRQLIWFRANPAINWLACDELTAGDIKERALTIISGQISGL